MMINYISKEIIAYLDRKNYFFDNLSFFIKKDIDDVLNNIDIRKPVVLLNETPNILKNLAISNLPIYENPSHVRKNILSVDDAKKLGLSISNRDHFHGLGIYTYLSALDSIDSSNAIYKYCNCNELFIITDNYDEYGNIIVIPFVYDTNTYVNNKLLNINRIKSIYGYDNSNIRLYDYINYKISNDELILLYTKKEQGTGTSTAASSFYKDNITKSLYNVNSGYDELLLLLTVL